MPDPDSNESSKSELLKEVEQKVENWLGEKATSDSPSQHLQVQGRENKEGNCGTVQHP